MGQEENTKKKRKKKESRTLAWRNIVNVTFGGGRGQDTPVE
jgi:hypothetical protein